MSWGTVELEPEVAEWCEALSDLQFGRVEFDIDLLAERGALLGEPYTRQLRGKLRELRFYLGSSGDAVRISYYIAAGRRIILLTVFRNSGGGRRRKSNERGGRCRNALPRAIPWRRRMSKRESWESVKSARADTKARRAGYAAASDAFELGARVRAERERLGLTQAELALQMGTNQPTVARLEAGGVTPSLDTLHRVAEALGLELVVDFRQAASG